MKNKAFSFINIFGLSVGLATCFLIMMYILDEKSVDDYHHDGDRVFRIAFVSNSINKGESWSSLAAPVAFALKKDLPEVEEVTRILRLPGLDQMLISYESKEGKRQFFEENGFYADSTLFSVFTYSFRYGNAQSALKEPNSIVISKEISERLFGNHDPIGKTVTVGMMYGESPFTVKGVFDDAGKKSHIPAGYFLSMHNAGLGNWVESQTNWATNNIFHTYVKLKKGSTPKNFESKLDPFFINHAGREIKETGLSRTFFLQPLPDIYLKSNIGNELAANGNIKYIFILASIALFILLIACVNFMNLSTARSEKRAREVGVRKVLGAERMTLVKYFLGESLFVSGLALIFALLLVKFLMPVFNGFTQKNITLSGQPQILVWMVVLTFLTGIVSGLYPAVYLSSFKPISVIKGRIITAMSATLIRKGLVVFQFTVSICLILGAIVIIHQLAYLRNQYLGFNGNQQIIIPLKSTEGANNYSAFKNELQTRPFVRSVTCGSFYPGMGSVLNDMLFFGEGKTSADQVDITMGVTDVDYLKTLGIPLLYGRDFSPKIANDSGNIILNEAAVRQIGYDVQTAVGKSVYYEIGQPSRREMKIIGVVKNFNFADLHNEIKPFGFATDYFANKNSYIIANVKFGAFTSQLDEMEKVWKKVNPNTPFQFNFLDQDFQKNYDKEKLTSEIVVSFTGIAVVLACLGLFGLAAFSAEQRTREIGIRKVLGASVASVATLLSKDFIKLVIIAIGIGSPLAWFALNRWLQAFAYKINITIWMFVEAGMLAVLVAIITVSFLAIRAAGRNPIQSLRAE